MIYVIYVQGYDEKRNQVCFDQKIDYIVKFQEANRRFGTKRCVVPEHIAHATLFMEKRDHVGRFVSVIRAKEIK